MTKCLYFDVFAIKWTIIKRKSRYTTKSREGRPELLSHFHRLTSGFKRKNTVFNKWPLINLTFKLKLTELYVKTHLRFCLSDPELHCLRWTDPFKGFKLRWRWEWSGLRRGRLTSHPAVRRRAVTPKTRLTLLPKKYEKGHKSKMYQHRYWGKNIWTESANQK